MSETKTTYIMPDQNGFGSNDLATMALLGGGGGFGGFGGNGMWNNPFMYLVWLYMMRWMNGNGDWGNNNAVWDAYLRRRGFKRYICPNDCPYCYSVEDFANEHPDSSYILATGTHAVACVSGNWIDAWDSGYVAPIYYYTKDGD